MFKSQLLATKCVFKQQDLQMFQLKYLQIWVILTHLKAWVAVARHNLM